MRRKFVSRKRLLLGENKTRKLSVPKVGGGFGCGSNKDVPSGSSPHEPIQRRVIAREINKLINVNQSKSESLIDETEFGKSLYDKKILKSKFYAIEIDGFLLFVEQGDFNTNKLNPGNNFKVYVFGKHTSKNYYGYLHDTKYDGSGINPTSETGNIIDIDGNIKKYNSSLLQTAINNDKSSALISSLPMTPHEQKCALETKQKADAISSKAAEKKAAIDKATRKKNIDEFAEADLGPPGILYGNYEKGNLWDAYQKVVKEIETLDITQNDKKKTLLKSAKQVYDTLKLVIKVYYKDLLINNTKPLNNFADSNGGSIADFSNIKTEITNIKNNASARTAAASAPVSAAAAPKSSINSQPNNLGSGAADASRNGQTHGSQQKGNRPPPPSRPLPQLPIKPTQWMHAPPTAKNLKDMKKKIKKVEKKVDEEKQNNSSNPVTTGL